MMPMQNNCTPPKNVMIQAKEAQPSTGSPNNSLRTVINKTARKANAVIIRPNQEAMLSGACEKLIIPSMAYLVSFQKFHLLSPAERFLFS